MLTQANGSKTINRSINYHSYYKKKRQRCGCNESNTIRPRVQDRKQCSTYTLEKKLNILQRIKCRLKETNGKPVKNKPKLDCHYKVSAAYTRKENKYRYCNTTQDLNLTNTYEEQYACLMALKSYNCVDEKNAAKIKDPAHCGVY